MKNKWVNWLIYGGTMPDISEDWPELEVPKTKEEVDNELRATDYE